MLQCCENDGQIMGVGADCESFEKPEKSIIFESPIFENKTDSKIDQNMVVARKFTLDNLLKNSLKNSLKKSLKSEKDNSNFSSKSLPSEYTVPTCDDTKQLTQLPNGRYGCAEKDECRSTTNCAYSLVPDCGETTRLVSYSAFKNLGPIFQFGNFRRFIENLYFLAENYSENLQK